VLELSQKQESRAQSVHSSKAYRKPRALFDGLISKKASCVLY